MFQILAKIWQCEGKLYVRGRAWQWVWLEHRVPQIHEGWRKSCQQRPEHISLGAVKQGDNMSRFVFIECIYVSRSRLLALSFVHLAYICIIYRNFSKCICSTFSSRNFSRLYPLSPLFNVHFLLTSPIFTRWDVTETGFFFPLLLKNGNLVSQLHGFHFGIC